MLVLFDESVDIFDVNIFEGLWVVSVVGAVVEGGTDGRLVDGVAHAPVQSSLVVHHVVQVRRVRLEAPHEREVAQTRVAVTEVTREMVVLLVEIHQVFVC